MKVLITEKESSDEDGEKSVKYIREQQDRCTSEPSHRVVRVRWRIEMFFINKKQDLGLGDCELRSPAGASRHWHLLMLAYSLLKLGVAQSALGTVISRATSLRTDLKLSFREAVQNLLSWALSCPNRSIDDLMHEVEDLFI